MLAIDDLRDTVLAEGMTALSDVRVAEGLEANNTLSELAHYFVHADLHLFVVLRLTLL